jgi:hypothetical protein
MRRTRIKSSEKLNASIELTCELSHQTWSLEQPLCFPFWLGPWLHITTNVACHPNSAISTSSLSPTSTMAATKRKKGKNSKESASKRSKQSKVSPSNSRIYLVPSPRELTGEIQVDEIPRASLLGLPGELRSRIWRFSLLEDCEIRIDTNNHQAPGLLRTSKQCRHEATKIFHEENSFIHHILHHHRESLRHDLRLDFDELLKSNSVMPFIASSSFQSSESQVTACV